MEAAILGVAQGEPARKRPRLARQPPRPSCHHIEQGSVATGQDVA
jgi:hypothetical protein